MNWQKLRYSLWILGFIFLAFSVLNFVDDVFLETRGKTAPEQWVMGIGVVVGTSLVMAYWGSKWYKYKDYVIGDRPFPLKEVGLGIGALVGFIVLIIIFISFVFHLVKSAPEYKESQEFIRNNSAVRAKLGAIKGMELDNMGTSIEISGADRSGSYQLRVEGSLAKSVLRIDWHDEKGKFVPTEIDEIVSLDKSAVLWTRGAR